MRGSRGAADAFLVSILPEKDDEKGRQECLPHLHTCFLNCLTSHFAGVEIIDSRIKQLTVTIRELTMLPGVSPGTANPKGVSCSAIQPGNEGKYDARA